MSDNANPTATLVTSKGEMKIELWPNVARGNVGPEFDFHLALGCDEGGGWVCVVAHVKLLGQ